jgi:PBP1b-binding outer membrane lipoprotein LpoB
MKRFAALLLLPTALIGCVGTPDPQVSALDTTPQCEREQPTGSKLHAVRCRTAAERQMDQRDVEALTEATRRTRSNLKPGV